jgi:hypothetical protein
MPIEEVKPTGQLTKSEQLAVFGQRSTAIPDLHTIGIRKGGTALLLALPGQKDGEVEGFRQSNSTLEWVRGNC